MQSKAGPVVTGFPYSKHFLVREYKFQESKKVEGRCFRGRAVLKRPISQEDSNVFQIDRRVGMMIELQLASQIPLLNP
jgi:hypothetical protein